MTGRVECVSFSPQEILERFDPSGRHLKFIDLLLAENRKLNLVSRETSREDLVGLIAESLLPLTQFELPIRDYLDIGSGGGLPSLPILLSGNVEGRALLVERVQKKSAALRRMIYALDLAAELPALDFDQISPEGDFHLITVRLVKLTPGLLARAGSLLHPDGTLLYFARPETGLTVTGLQASVFEYTSGKSPKHFTLFRKL